MERAIRAAGSDPKQSKLSFKSSFVVNAGGTLNIAFTAGASVTHTATQSGAGQHRALSVMAPVGALHVRSDSAPAFVQGSVAESMAAAGSVALGEELSGAASACGGVGAPSPSAEGASSGP
jgi:hypothetical protein